jgi:predicted O-methyltransferase YrrM
MHDGYGTYLRESSDRRGRQAPLREATLGELERMRREEHPLRAIAEALGAVLHHRLTEEEQAWVDRIEGLRRELEASRDVVPIALPYPRAKPKFSTVGEVCRLRSKRPAWGLLLFKLVRQLKPTICLELGTCLGVSGAYMGAALELNHSGRLATLEGADALASLAEKNLQGLGLKRVSVKAGLFQETLTGELGRLDTLDFAFIDGHHDEHATLVYLEQILPYLKDEAVVVFDDIAWSDGMKRAWAKVKADPRVRVSVDLETIGLCIASDTVRPKTAFAFASLTRLQAAFSGTAERIAELIERTVPRGAVVLIVSKGDEQLVCLEGRQGRHFPQDEEGRYVGYHPGTGREAIEHLERARGKGADYLLIPNPSLWWLDYYKELTDHLRCNYRLVAYQEHVAVLYALEPQALSPICLGGG